MRPIMAAAAGASVVAMTEPERGEHLFAAKGCATCHVEMKVIPVDVRTNKYDQKFVKQLLADPRSVPKRHNARRGDAEPGPQARGNLRPGGVPGGTELDRHSLDSRNGAA